MLLEIKDNVDNFNKVLELLKANNVRYENFNNTKVYHSVGGSDIYVKINTEIVGEIHTITFDESEKTLVIKLTMFNTMFSKREEQLKKLTNGTVSYVTQTEYDNRKFGKTFYGVKYITTKASFAIDHTSLQQDFIFSYESCTNHIELGE